MTASENRLNKLQQLRRSVNPKTGRQYSYADCASIFGVTRQALQAMVSRSHKTATVCSHCGQPLSK